MTLQRRKLNAMKYLATRPNYRLIHKGAYVNLEHYGSYGYSPGGVHKQWKVIENIYFWEKEDESNKSAWN
jgi:hypothetical protein